MSCVSYPSCLLHGLVEEGRDRHAVRTVARLPPDSAPLLNRRVEASLLEALEELEALPHHTGLLGHRKLLLLLDRHIGPHVAQEVCLSPFSPTMVAPAWGLLLGLLGLEEERVCVGCCTVVHRDNPGSRTWAVGFREGERGACCHGERAGSRGDNELNQDMRRCTGPPPCMHPVRAALAAEGGAGRAVPRLRREARGGSML